MPRMHVTIATIAAALLTLGACSNGERAVEEGDATMQPAGDTGVTAPAAVDTAGDSVTVEGALKSTEQPLQPPPTDSARRGPPR